jgi:parvulin-like peptidyl-prolyl isomerase
MRGLLGSCWSVAVLGLCSFCVQAQQPAAPEAPPAVPGGNAVAATVNGQPILEVAVQRGLQRVPPARHKEARPELLNYLIDNVLIDQYLQQLQVAVDSQEVDKHLAEIKAEMTKEKRDFAKMLQEMQLTEAELRQHITADLRWEKFADSRATDKVLAETFTSQRYLFDGSQVHARHILLTAPGTDPQAAAEAIKNLKNYRAEIEQKVAAGLAKLPPQSDNLEREKARTRLLDDAFVEMARSHSACPSKERGGDVGWFQGIGFMVEPFSRAAFALKPFEISDVVKTPFGYHLIMPIDRKPGREVKLEDVKELVKEYYSNSLRESLARQVRERSQIVITPVK